PVLWLGRQPEPFGFNIRPLNQVLAWRLVCRNVVAYQQGEITRVSVPFRDGDGPGWKYAVGVSTGEQPEYAHEVIVRYGPRKISPLEEDGLENIGRQMAGRRAADAGQIASQVDDHFTQS